MKYIFLFFALTSSFFGENLNAQMDSTNIVNGKEMFELLTKNGGRWINQNDQFDSTDVNGFSHFIMEFKMDEFDFLEGTISGINGKKQKIPFWKVLEFIDPHTGGYVFVQRGTLGYSIASSTFHNKKQRQCNFDITYYNGAVEKHRDLHTLIDDHTLQSRSEIYNDAAKKWEKQPAAIWKREQN